MKAERNVSPSSLSRTLKWTAVVVLLTVIAYFGVPMGRRYAAIQQLTVIGAKFHATKSTRFGQLAARLLRTKVEDLPLLFSDIRGVEFSGTRPLTPADVNLLLSIGETSTVYIEDSSTPVSLPVWPALPPQIRHLSLRATRAHDSFDRFLESLEPSATLTSLTIEGGVTPQTLTSVDCAPNLQSLDITAIFGEVDLTFLKRYSRLKKLKIDVHWTDGTESVILDLPELEVLHLPMDTAEWIEAVRAHPRLQTVADSPVAAYLRRMESRRKPTWE